MTPEGNEVQGSAPAIPPERVEGQQQEPHVVSTAPAGLVSIIVPCCGQLEYTRLCLPSLLRYTRKPYDLVFLDSGSLDGTADYLAGVAAAAPVRVEVLRAPVEAGFAVASNEGSLRARGEYIVLLSNDTIVTERWLDHLLALTVMDAALGIVAPMSNYGPPAQHVGPVPYRLDLRRNLLGVPTTEPEGLVRAIEEVNRFARDWREQHKGQWFRADRLGGGCVLLRREVLKKIGLVLNRSALGFFDLEILSQRLVQAGYHLAGCKDVFVHHFGSRSPAMKSTASSGS